ncbi:OmpA family protein [Psychrobacter sp. DM4]|uniref:OmpA family protein n=1 Tax=Psychrobacter sp. DM4 TaxID=3440637 RepID=UPI003F501EE7
MKQSVYCYGALATVLLLSVTGCTRNISTNLTDDGRVSASDLVFPEQNTAWREEGTIADVDDLAKIRPGISKDDLYQLIGPPHFSESYKAREWDYILKFYDNNQQVKVCQYKVIFDKEYKGQEFYWSPADCPPQSMAVMQTNPVMVASVPTMQPAPERINLNADALFAFDKSTVQDVLPQGREELDGLAQTLRQYQQRGDSQIMITGHTDRKGDDAYNMNLSTQRARAVANYLVNQGVNPNTIIATGAGELQPIVQCSTNLPRQQEIDCLQPNRRVTLDITVNQ